MTRATTSDGLIAERNGQCGSWVDLLRDVLLAQGIENFGVHRVVPDPAVGPANAILGLAVKNWTFLDPGQDYGMGNDFRYKLDLDAKVGSGVPGQGPNLNPISRFSEHYVLSYALPGPGEVRSIYDPSYGKKFDATGTISAKRAWENGALEGIFIAQATGSPVFIGGIMKKKDTSKDETVFIPPLP